MAEASHILLGVAGYLHVLFERLILRRALAWSHDREAYFAAPKYVNMDISAATYGRGGGRERSDRPWGNVLYSPTVGHLGGETSPCCGAGAGNFGPATSYLPSAAA